MNSGTKPFWDNPPDRALSDGNEGDIKKSESKPVKAASKPKNRGVSFDSGCKPPPHDLNTEKAIIGAVLTNPEAFSLIAGKVRSEEFYDPRHVAIMEAVEIQFDNSQPIDPITISTKLRNSGKAESSGGVEYLAELVSLSVSLTAVEHYATVVRDNCVLRNVINAAALITSGAYNAGNDISGFLSQTQAQISQAVELRVSDDVRDMPDLIREAVERLRHRRENGGIASGISSGYVNVDNILAGFKNSELLILAARPSLGKTSFAMNLAFNAARAGYYTLFASLEMGNDALADRMLSLQTGIDSSRIQTSKYIAGEEMPRLERACEKYAALPLMIDDNATLSVLELRAKCCRLKKQDKLDLVVVDYLQLMEPADKRVPREQQVSGLSRSLKALAKELNIPVIALSQLSRASEQRSGSDRRPMLSDLRESGAIEQDADVVMFLYRQDYYKKMRGGAGDSMSDRVKELNRLSKNAINDDAGNEEENQMEVIVAKHRNGTTGVAKMRFIPEIMGVTDWETPEQIEKRFEWDV